jgi:hypothetical protein
LGFFDLRSAVPQKGGPRCSSREEESLKSKIWLRELVVSPNHYIEILEIEGRFGFSCNSRGQVWPATKAGYTHERDRNYLDGWSPVLDEIVSEVLVIDGQGGRFLFVGSIVVMARSDEPVVAVRVLDGVGSSVVVSNGQ